MLTQQLAIKLKTLIHISLMTFNYDIRCIEICVARNKKSTCIANLNGNVLKIKESHEIHLLKENGVMGAFLCETCHFQRLRRNLVSLAQRTRLGLYF